MSGPGTPVKGGTTSNPSKKQPQAHTPHVKASVEGHNKVNTQEQSPTYDEHVGGRVTQTTTSKKKIYAGITVAEDVETVTTQTSGGNSNYYSGGAQRQTESYIGGKIEIDNKPAQAGGKASAVKPAAKPKASSPKLKAPTVALPAEDAIIVTTEVDNLQLRNADIGVDADKDAMMVAAAAQRLRKTLDKGGALGDAAKADIAIKGLENIDQLAVFFQKDYTSVQEGKIKLQYTDHRDPSFNAAIGEMSLTHEGAVKLSTAFDKASKAVEQLVSNVSPGQTVSQSDITNTVRSTLKKELSIAP